MIFFKSLRSSKTNTTGTDDFLWPIAHYLGTTGSARMVGWAMNVSRSHSEFVPAQRVVNRNGLHTGKHHFDNSNAMKELLENKGI